MLCRLRAGFALAQSIRLRRASDAAGGPSSSFNPEKFCGISPERAPAASKRATFQSSEKADAILQFLSSHGFDEAQVAECVGKHPKLLRLDAEKQLRPKLEALEAAGFSKSGIDEMLRKCPAVLGLTKSNGLFSTVVAIVRRLIPEEADFVTVLIRYPWIMSYTTLSRISPNVDLLLKEGVPMKNISCAFLNKPRTFNTEPSRFVELVQIVKDMGFRPSTSPFLTAIQARTVQEKWDQNLKVYKSFGLNVDQILSAFKKQPSILLLTEKKIMKMMGYFVGVKGIAPASLVKYPVILTLSLEKRIIPRYKVLEMLADRGIVTNYTLQTVLRLTDKEFLAKYVTGHAENIPGLLNLYHANMIQ